jgi:hypothetical protein
MEVKMAKYFVLIILLLFLTGCSMISVEKEVTFNTFYTEIIGFSESNEKIKPIPNDVMLMVDNKEYQDFTDKYLTVRELPIEDPDKEKAVLFIQIPSESLSVQKYGVINIKIKGKQLIIELIKNSTAFVNPADGFENAIFKWIALVEIDKSHLSNKMDIIVNK